MPWIEESLAGRTTDIFEPTHDRKPFVILFLHGTDQQTLRGKRTFEQLLEQYRLPAICPNGRQAWWTDRICPPFDERRSAEQFILEDVLPYIERRWEVRPPGIGLLGVCMGGQGALRLAFRFPRIFPVVAALAPAIDYYLAHGHGTILDLMYDSAEDCRLDAAPMHINPADFPPYIFFSLDPEDTFWYRGVDRLQEKLRALGIPFTGDLATSAGGHTWQYFEHMAPKALHFVHEGLVAMARRLL
ncbi:MAG: esterase [Gemmataceae bacterium]